ncbi:MAG TPA: DinB family protein [Gemmatimonadaceae bacterium]
MSRILTTLAAASLVALAAAPAGAQAAASAPAPAPAPTSTGVAAIRGVYQGAQRNLLAVAEQLPDSAFAWRPTAQVRTAGELLAHVANAHNMICSAALGEANPADENYEKTRTTKAAIADALRTSSAVCERAFAQSDADAAATTKLFGRDQSRMSALAVVAIHDWEHYGNLVTYMRILGMVPPSSQ